MGFASESTGSDCEILYKYFKLLLLLLRLAYLNSLIFFLFSPRIY